MIDEWKASEPNSGDFSRLVGIAQLLQREKAQLEQQLEELEQENEELQSLLIDAREMHQAYRQY